MRVFKEVQRFNQWWMQLVNLSMVLLLGYLCYSWYFSGNTVDDVAPDNWILQLLVIGSIGITLLLLLILKLRTEIDNRGIHYQFLPFHRNKKSIPWEEMESCRVRTYNAIREYGGWGFRASFGNGKAYNVKGNQGIQIALKNGQKLLLGTQKMKEAAQVIDRYSNKNNDGY
ncbi:MAG: DUF6141 family protein [Flavobacteriaceae bacterium]